MAAGGVSASELMRSCDWARTPLGPRAEWPRVVEHVVRTLLEAPIPVCYQHGPSLAMVYNDAFAALLGEKHPAAFAAPTAEVVAEVWHQPNVGPVFHRALEHGRPFLEDGVQLRLRRGAPAGRGAPGGDHADAGFYLRAGSPVRDDDGSIVGLVHVVVETTRGVERVQAVASLAAALAAAVTVDDVCKAALHHLVLGLPVQEAGVCVPPLDGGPWHVTRRRWDEQFSSAEARLPLVWSALEGAHLASVQVGLEAAAGGLDAAGGMVTLPLDVDGREGAITLLTGERALPAETEAALLSAAALVGQALSRAQLFDRERTNAERLQRALLPLGLPQPASYGLAGVYEPVARGAVVGGDFYDAFDLPGGRLAVVIGDVVGRGAAAATIMGQIRAGARGAALTDPDPVGVLAALDLLVEGLERMWPSSVPPGGATPTGGWAQGFGGELFVTMLFAVLDPETGELQLASAGHCAPAVVSPGGAAPAATAGAATAGGPAASRLVDLETGPPLGLGGPRVVHGMRLEPGEMLFAFTDGLLERRARSLDSGEQRLLEVLADLSATTARGACDEVVARMADGEGFEDDCALVVLARTAREHRTATLVVPPEPGAVRPARAWARLQLEEWDVPTETQFAVVTGLSELVTNAVLHAGTDAVVTLELDGHSVTVTVSDTGRRGVPRPLDIEVAATRGRGLALVRTISDAFGARPSATGSTVWFAVGEEAAAYGPASSATHRPGSSR